MPSHMGVQTYATSRNQQAEILVDYILSSWVEILHDNGYITSLVEPTRQKSFIRDDCSDVFDHYLEIELALPVGNLEQGALVQIWAQTTTYKGNARGKPEPNKTYEIRETLIEALGLRRWLQEEKQIFRTLHFTVGSEDYTYDWFKLAKNNAFDVSLYPDSGLDMEQVFSRLQDLFENITFGYEYYEKLEKEVEQTESVISRFVLSFRERLYQWFLNGAPPSTVANAQVGLLNRLRREQASSVIRAIDESRKTGAHIKKQAFALLTQGSLDESDPAMFRTLKKLLKKNPFLIVALDAESDWDAWSRSHFAIPAHIDQLTEYIAYLWTRKEDVRLISRRLLMRIHTDESIHYIQDTGIKGLTEHNLYGGNHNQSQVESITNLIAADCKKAGITTPQQLFDRLASSYGKQLVRAGRIFEAKNGTSITPSFDYIVEVLSDRFFVKPISRVKTLPQPIAYHDEFGGATVRPYQNLKVVISKKTLQPLAILKAKFFSRAEFSRRVKEESYVGITTKFTYNPKMQLDVDTGQFTERYKGIPLIMFVDMEESLDPPVYAVRRLITAGWNAFFSVESLVKYLDNLETDKAKIT